ncbi:pantoate--beta-alanine ligase [Govanella unica]|uniref:Pantothenate synthetase n=1 Tax=Govanella unica TaxID=2975056 RepID=A0A9X3Z6G2_9PROT|nr:pantoate--beta-alanine ligase [Govania unica]MDA5193096.1 pantoate--beta-alanine ligase [Govania unica]
MATPLILRSVRDLRAMVARWRQAGERVALVPTMGALHDGHLSLVRQAQTLADHVVVSIFVNPKQFGPKEDFGSYPRQEQADAAKLASVQCDVLFAPSVDEMYPAGFATNISVSGVTEGLCGAARPGHFDGVATVVTKLLLQCLPDVAIFGEKDYQQLATIRRFVRDLDIPVEILGGPTLREQDGLALSSRNAYLSTEERSIAAALPAMLKTLIAKLADKNADLATLITDGKAALLKAGFSSVEYLELRDAETLAPLNRPDRPARILVAARLGKTRLIDNMPVDQI